MSFVFKSIYHAEIFGARRTIRLNLRAIREIMPDFEIKGFDLTAEQRRILQSRATLYQKMGGKIDLQSGCEEKPEKLIPARTIRAGQGRKMPNGERTKPTPAQFIPAHVQAAKPAVEPSIDHLPNKLVLSRVLSAAIKERGAA
jgi:hypothetical protein